MFSALSLQHSHVAAHSEVEELGRQGSGTGARHVAGHEQVHALRRQVLGDDGRPARRVPPPGSAGQDRQTGADQAQQCRCEADAGERIRRERLVAGHEGAGFEPDRQGQPLGRVERSGGDVDRDGFARGLHCQRRAGCRRIAAALIARCVPGEPGSDLRVDGQGGRDVAERLRPAGAVDLPIELLERGIRRFESDVELLVGDHVGLRAVHVVVGGDRHLEELVSAVFAGRFGVGVAFLTVLVGHADQFEVGRMPVVVGGDGAPDAAVLVGRGEPGHDRLGCGQA